MIDGLQYNYYIIFLVLTVSLVVTYIKLKGNEGTTITTKEFKDFQTNFLVVYGVMVLAELITIASFYHIMISFGFEWVEIAKLFVVTVLSTTIFSNVLEIVDFGSRRDQCIVSAVLYAISMFCLLLGGHFDILLVSRVIYGAASALHHSAFETYLVNEHTVSGFPEEWLGQTFSLLPHVMALVAVLSGPMGQVSASMRDDKDNGPSGLGCAILCIVLYVLMVVFMGMRWRRDVKALRYTWSTYTFSMKRTLQAIGEQDFDVVRIIALSFCFETCVTLLSFFWAPWLAAYAQAEGFDSTTTPYAIVYACFIASSLLGNYLYQIFTAPTHGSDGGTGRSLVSSDFILQCVLVSSCVGYFLGSVFQTPVLVFLVCICPLHLGMGAYWSCIGRLRAEYLLPEMKSATMLIARSGTFAVISGLLLYCPFSPSLVMCSCSLLCGIGAIVQTGFTPVEEQSLSDQELDM